MSDADSAAPAAVMQPRPRVVIVGAGFGGLWATKQLTDAPVDILVVDRRNHHLFQPLLYQVATAALSAADIASPIRAVVGRYPNVMVLMDKVVGVDTEAREVVMMDGRKPYDYLVIATGAGHSYFGHDEWASYAPGLKSIEDATDIRRRILLAFERAECLSDSEERKRNMTLVVVGGGPTGVEMAGAMADLAKRALAKDFHAIDPRRARILLLEAGPRLLPTFAEDLSASAERALNRLGVEVKLNAPVAQVDGDGVIVGSERIPSRTVIWAAGVAASSAALWLQAEHDRAGRIKVNPDLSVPGHPNIFAIGDTALAFGPDSKPLPGIAPVAKQQGRYVGTLIKARIAGSPGIGPFRYKHYGDLATIGRKAAVVDFRGWHLHGFPAWLVWSIAHIWFLIGFRNRLIVATNWLWNYATFQLGARIITRCTD